MEKIKKINIGFDLGSRLAKLVVLQNHEIIYSDICDSGINPKLTSEIMFSNMLKNKEMTKDDIRCIYSTGYGRNVVPFADRRISEISCHAKGCHYFFDIAGTIIDIGGQDSKIIIVDEQGKVRDFAMNDKCAAGTGRFLEVVANILEITVEDLGKLSKQSKENIDINSTCVVFAESEIIGLIAAGKEPAAIIKAVHWSIAKRIRNLLAQTTWRKPVIFTGGVAKNSGMKTSISEVLNVNLLIPERSLITGALGAALYAEEESSN